MHITSCIYCDPNPRCAFSFLFFFLLYIKMQMDYHYQYVFLSAFLQNIASWDLWDHDLFFLHSFSIDLDSWTHWRSCEVEWVEASLNIQTNQLICWHSEPGVHKHFGYAFITYKVRAVAPNPWDLQLAAVLFQYISIWPLYDIIPAPWNYWKHSVLCHLHGRHKTSISCTWYLDKHICVLRVKAA